MKLTRTVLTAAVAAVAISGATLAMSTDASAMGGKGFRKHGHYGFHFRRFGHRWRHRHFWFHRVRYSPCWTRTPFGWVYVCRFFPY
jgi:hypothetical protein